MSRVFIQYLIERVYSFFISFMFNQVKASLKGFIVNDNNSSDSLFCNKSCSSFECYLIIIIIIIIVIIVAIIVIIVISISGMQHPVPVVQGYVECQEEDEK